MKILFLMVSFSIVIIDVSFSQTPTIQWQNTIGGNNSDNFMAMDQTLDGGFVLIGHSQSKDSLDKTEDCFDGGYDYWIIKVNSIGEIEWQNNIGGFYWRDFAAAVKTTSDGYIIGGSSESDSSGDKTENCLGNLDFWVLKLDNFGNIVWQNTVGGSAKETLKSVLVADDGGYLIAGESSSGESEDKSEDIAGYWVVKMDAIGNIVWENTYASDMYDQLNSVCKALDGGYLLGGTSSGGIANDKTEASMGLGDYWVIRIDSLGNIVWQNTIGGTSTDILMSVSPISDGGFYLGGLSYSDISGDKTENELGDGDYWIVKIDSMGNILWNKNVGGTDWDWLWNIITTADHGCLASGWTDSGISGDKTEPNYGYRNNWLVKLDSLGNIEWQKGLGGNSYDYCWYNPVVQTADGGYLFCSDAASGISGNKTEESNGYDYWLVKLAPCSSEICNGFDDDCDLVIDNDLIFEMQYRDADGDGFGNALIDSLWCNAIAGYVADSTDCNDEDNMIFPGAPETVNGMDDNCNQLIDESTGVVEIQSNLFAVYPNPANNIITIAFRLKPPGITDLKIFSTSGQLIYSEKIISEENNLSQTISLDNLSPGIYFIHISDGVYLSQEKLIIQ